VARVSRFLERLQSGPPLVADGGMGALIAATAPGLRCPEEANVRAPESVVAVHASYIAAGAELIETNTFGATRRKLARLMLEGEFERIVSGGARLAREAREVAGKDVFVAGSIGPLGETARLSRPLATLDFLCGPATARRTACRAPARPT
jgi:methionine synthase / methylenetetrahydrofolate reductase(NADPH)